jgi:pyruvate dehydrogenase E1 component beta subunit
MDIDTVVDSVKKTGRLLITHESRKRGGVAGEIAFRFTETAPDVAQTMKTPIKRLATKNVVFTRRANLGPLLIPQVEDVVKAVKEMV